MGDAGSREGAIPADGAQRDLFVRCFMEAERRAEEPGQVTSGDA